jgi:Xaa-Pro dipeptidase
MQVESTIEAVAPYIATDPDFGVSSKPVFYTVDMVDITAIQAALADAGVDAWLLYDFRGSNILAQRVLGLDGRKFTRRWAYCIPRNGAPRKLAHAIEPAALDSLPGSKIEYRRWQDFESGVATLVGGARRVAMEYSPRNGNPYISRVDAGTVELVRATGADVVSSGDLIQLFESTWNDEQIASHHEAATHTNAAYSMVWAFIAEQVRTQGFTTECTIQQRIMDYFAAHGMTTYSPPIVGCNANSGDPHFEPNPARDVKVQAGDFVLVDLWAKMDRPRAVYSDLTRVGFVGATVPEKYQRTFDIVARARDAAIKTVRDAMAAARPLTGAEVDDACRSVIVAAGFGDAFTHRTGHNIGQEVHGNGAHIDGLETREDRRILPRTCFSVEPGIYLPDYGVRSEINVLIAADGTVHVTGGDLQYDVVAIM